MITLVVGIMAAVITAASAGWWIGYSQGLRLQLDAVVVEQATCEAYTAGWHDGRAVGVQIGIAAAERLESPRSDYRIDPGGALWSL